MSQSVVKNLSDGTIKIVDGTTGTPQFVEIVVDEGDLSFDIAQRESVVIHDRTELNAIRIGKAKPGKGKFSVKYKEFLRSGSNPVTPHEAIFMTGGAAGWLSTNTDGGGVKTVDIVFTVVSPVIGEDAEIITFPRCFNIKESFSEKLDGDQIAIDFEYMAERPTIAKGTTPMTSQAPTTGS